MRRRGRPASDAVAVSSHALVRTLERIAEEYYPKTLIIAGGVACNDRLTTVLQRRPRRIGGAPRTTSRQ